MKSLFGGRSLAEKGLSSKQLFQQCKARLFEAAKKPGFFDVGEPKPVLLFIIFVKLIIFLSSHTSITLSISQSHALFMLRTSSCSVQATPMEPNQEIALSLILFRLITSLLILILRSSQLFVVYFFSSSFLCSVDASQEGNKIYSNTLSSNVFLCQYLSCHDFRDTITFFVFSILLYFFCESRCHANVVD